MLLRRPLVARLTALALLLGGGAAPAPAATATPASDPARAIDAINFGWRFARGSHPEATRPDFDDSRWEPVDLPHDWAISGPFDPAGDPDTGKLPWKGEGWYRKRFMLPKDARGQRLQFIFDGVMASPTVYLNGQEVGSWIYGYNSFWIDATDAAVFGGENVLTVHADTREHGSRWYPGAGIYRKVTLRLVDPVHIPVWGVYVTTPSVGDAVAEVRAEIDVANASGRAATIGIEAAIIAPDGHVVATKRRDLEVAGDADQVRFDFTVAEPLRWDIAHPHLYTLRTRVMVGGKEVDRAATTFGIRTFQWTANDGFFLNGRLVDLKGVNEHHTHGLLGAAFFPRAMERKLEILREMGINALRTSHNPDAPEVLEMCDRLGIVVINELYDKWNSTAGKPVGAAEYIERYAEAEIRNFLLRDRNHPSVVAWSIANEEGAILSDRDGQSAKLVAQVVDYFKTYDATRPTMMVGHIPQGADRDKRIFDTVDVSGWNYSSRYMNFRQNYPEKPISYTETASAFGTRGYFDLNLPKTKTDYGPGPYQSDYGLTAAIWADIPEHEFERMRKDTFLCGNFVWTGFDYLGEPTPVRGQRGGGPELSFSARSSYFGIVDLAGLPKSAFYLYRSLWRDDEHTVHVTPHWNWSAGDRVPVILYTDGDEAELFLNGRSLGRKAKLDPDQIQPANLAFGQTVNATSSEIIQDAGGNVIIDRTPDKAIDGNPETRWRAESGNFPQVWDVDLGQSRRFSRITIQWDSRDPRYEFELQASLDGQQWSSIEGERTNVRERMTIALEPMDARYLKMRFLGHPGGNPASIREFEVLDSESLSQDPYFDIVDAYRIRFLDIPYEPGELKAVAYKQGKRIGESSVRTAGPPARLELTPDRADLKADGMDLCYVTIRLLDAAGNLCPLAMNQLSFETTGAAIFMGADNGDQMGLDPLTDSSHPLFYGQAVAVLRSKPGASGPATLRVSADNGLESEIRVTVGAASAAPAALATPASNSVYLFTSFRGNGDGLHLAYSHNGLEWTDLNRVFLEPTVGSKLMRDPHILLGPDGLYHMVWTSGWNDTGIGYATSKNLIDWSEQRYLPLMAQVPHTQTCWAPELFYDDASKNYIILWSSNVSAQDAPKAGHHRAYYSLTKNFKTFTDPKILFDPGINNIDTTMMQVDGRYMIVFKETDDQPAEKWGSIHAAIADKPLGPYTLLPDPPLVKQRAEGPALVTIGGKTLLYVDYYANRRYGVYETTDWKTWTDVTRTAELVWGQRHGSILTVPTEILAGLQAYEARAVATVPKPILDGYTADPAIRAFGDRYYIYPTSDRPYWNTTEFAVWSSPNLIEWKKERVFIDLTKDISWANNKAWAPDCIERDGKYYFYFCANHDIGVAVGDSPIGPFKDALGRPLIENAKVKTFSIDPHLFIDDDGQAYLYFGNGTPSVYRLNRDMVSVDGELVEFKLKEFREGTVVFKRNGKYYFMWSIDDARSPDYRVGWGVSDSPYGPVVSPDAEKDFIVLRQNGAAVGTAHHSVLNVPGTDRWYVAYHRHAVPGGNGYKRETCLVRMEFNDDGSIKPMDPLTVPFQPGDAGEPLVNGRGRP